MFKKGVRVIALEEQDGNDKIIGQTGVIIGMESEILAMVQFDVRVLGHSGHGFDYITEEDYVGKNGYCWAVRTQRLTVLGNGSDKILELLVAKKITPELYEKIIRSE